MLYDDSFIDTPPSPDDKTAKGRARREAASHHVSVVARSEGWPIVSFITVKRLFREPLHPVSTATLEKIARALEVPVSELLEDVPDKDK